jgi:hypothetical protein
MKVGFLVLAACMVACSSNPSQGTGDAQKTAQVQEGQEGVVCTTERPTGSFLKEKKCTTPQQREVERRQQETLMELQNSRDVGAR